MPSTSDISSRVVDALAISDPELDTSIGSPVRKIIDAISNEMATVTSDSTLINYSQDIDSLTAGALDDFVANFGMARLAAQRSVGVVTFSRSSAIAATRATFIPVGTQVGSLSVPPVYMQTTVAANLDIGQTSVDVPVQAVSTGPSGNLTANAISSLLSSIDGVSVVANSNPFIGGTDAETDAQLRLRFTSGGAFRNLAGTDAMYRNLALQVLADPTDATSTAVSQVNILGSIKHQTEQVQVISGTATSSLTASAYNYSASTFVGLSDGSGSLLTNGAQYTVTVNNSVSPATLVITSTSSGMPDGIYNLEYDYVPIASRNDPLGTRWSNGSVNTRVDLWVNGQVNQTSTQSVFFQTSLKFNATAGNPLQNTRFVTLAGNHPAVNDVFVPFAYGPVVSVPASIVIGSTTYTLGTNYDIVHQDDAFGYTPTSAYGLVWYQAHLPANNAAFSMAVTYNSVPSLVQQAIENWRLLGTDVQVHAGKQILLKLHFAIVYLPNFTISSVNLAIQSAVATFLLGLGFDAGVQISDLVQVVHNVPGVDNVRLTNSVDNSINYGIQSAKPDGTTITTYNNAGRPIDVYFNDNQYPVLYSIELSPRARNSFRSG